MISWVGIALGAAALVVVAVQHAAGPFDREPPIEERVAEQAKSVYETLRRQFSDEEPAAAAEPPIQPRAARTGIDRTLRVATAACGALAVALAFAGFARREDPRACGSAAVLGVAALPLGLSIGVLLAALIVSLAGRMLASTSDASRAPGRELASRNERDQARL